MKYKKVFISGGAGVIGRELVSLLINEGAEIFVGDLVECPESFRKEVKYRQGDLNSLTKQEIEDFSPEIFFHLAATFERSTENYDFWEENHRHNCQLTHHLISLIKDLDSIKKIVFASSYLIYQPKLYQFKEPQTKAISLNEKDPIYPRNLIGVAKLSHEIDLRFLNEFKSENYDTICARIYRGYGCNSRDVISRWIRELIANKPIYLYKEEGIFDYIYAADSAKGLFKLSQLEQFNGIVNLGTGKGRKVSEIIKILKKYFPNMKVIKKDSTIDFEASEANIDLLKSKVNWEPEYDLEKAIPLIINHENKKLLKSSNSLKEIKVLITSSGKKTLLISAMKTALNKINQNNSVISGDIDENCVSKYVADDFWKMPLTNKENLGPIINYLHANNINIVLPSRDAELIFWSENYQNLKSQGINVIVSPIKSIEICLDKLKFYKFGKENDFNFIYTSQNISDLDCQTYVVKERYGAGSSSIGINLKKEEAIKHATSLKDPIFQPYIIGKEISIDAWISNSHKVKGVILRTRDLIFNGESKITTTFLNENLEKEAIKVLEALNLRGPVVLQGILQNENKVIFMECNSRFGGGSTTSISAGLDSFYWSILEIQGEDLKNYKFFKSTKKVKQVRISSDILINS